MLENNLRCFLGLERVQTLARNLIYNQFLELRRVRRAFEFAIVVHFEVAFRTRQDAKFGAVVQVVLKSIDVERHKLYGTLTQIEVEHIVAERKIEQFSFPDVEFICCLLSIVQLREVVAERLLHIRSLCSALGVHILHHPFRGITHYLRQGPYA